VNVCRELFSAQTARPVPPLWLTMMMRPAGMFAEAGLDLVGDLLRLSAVALAAVSAPEAGGPPPSSRRSPLPRRSPLAEAAEHLPSRYCSPATPGRCSRYVDELKTAADANANRGVPQPPADSARRRDEDDAQKA
jgi:hypothetical protein